MSADLRAGVLFDLDGTLVDTNYLHTLAWARALGDAGEWAPMNAIHRLVGMGGDQLVPRLLGHDNKLAHEARGRHYRALMADAHVFPGVAALLRRTHEHDLAVVLATSSPRDELEAMRERIEADDVIDAETTADDVETSKPEPDVFLTSMKAGEVDPARALAIGDSPWDVQAARAAGIGCIAVETGGFSRHELAESGAIDVYRDIGEVLQQFHTSPLAVLGSEPCSPGRSEDTGGT